MNPVPANNNIDLLLHITSLRKHIYSGVVIPDPNILSFQKSTKHYLLFSPYPRKPKGKKNSWNL